MVMVLFIVINMERVTSVYILLYVFCWAKKFVGGMLNKFFFLFLFFRLVAIVFMRRRTFFMFYEFYGNKIGIVVQLFLLLLSSFIAKINIFMHYLVWLHFKYTL